MPYNETFAIRIRNFFYEKNISFTEKKMFSGICFMVDDKMCCGTHIDKRTNEDVLMCRIGEHEYEKALENENCIPMEFTGKPMKGYLYVTHNGLKKTTDVNHWLQLCLDFNPWAKKSKK